MALSNDKKITAAIWAGLLSTALNSLNIAVSKIPGPALQAEPSACLTAEEWRQEARTLAPQFVKTNSQLAGLQRSLDSIRELLKNHTLSAASPD